MMLRKLIPCLLIALFAACQEPVEKEPVVIHVPFLQVKSAWADSLLRTMSLEEKIGQLLVLESNFQDSIVQDSFLHWVKKGQLGGYLLDSLPLQQYLGLADTAQQYASIPLLVGTNEQVVLNNQFSDQVPFPEIASLSAIKNDTLIQTFTEILITQSKSLNLNFSFAPNVELNDSTRAYNFNSYGDQKEQVFQKANYLMDELQEEKILSFAQSFDAYTGTTKDTTQAHLQSLAPFAKLVRKGLSGMVIGSSILEVDTIDRRPIGFLQDYLQSELGFNGLLIGRWGADVSLEKLLRVGADVFVVRDNLSAAASQLTSFYESGLINNEILDAKVAKVLMAKSWSGLDTLQPFLDFDVATHYMENKGYRLWAKSLFEQSIVLASNPKLVLPFKDVHRKNFRLFHYGKEQLGSFKNQFFKYASYTSQLLPPDVKTGQLKDLPNKRMRSAAIVITLDELNIDPVRDSTFLKSVNELGNKHPIVIVNFGNPYNLRYFKEHIASVQVFERNEYTAAQVAQLLFGGLSANGKLPVAIADHLPFGKSIFSPVTRMKYADPEEVGISPEKLVGIDAYIRGAIAYGATPGCQVLVAKEGKIIYSKSFGHHSFRKLKKTTTADLYDIASLTKVASTTLAGMRLFEQGKYKVNNRIKDYIDFPESSKIKDQRVKYLLAHRSRIQANMPVGKYLRFQDTTSQLEVNKYFSRTRQGDYTIQVADSMFFSKTELDSFWMDIEGLKLRKKKTYRYSDVNFNLLQRMFENLSDQPLDQYVHNNFYAPLSLRRTLYNPRSRFNPKHIVPTEDDSKFRKQLVHGYVHDESAALLGGVAGNAGLFSNAEDLAILFQMLLNKGTYGGKRFFNEKTIEYFTSSQHGNHRGLGFDKPKRARKKSVARSASKDTYGHTGFTGTCVWVDPKEDIIFVFLSNRVHPAKNNRKLFKKQIRGRAHEVVYDALDSYKMDAHLLPFPVEEKKEKSITELRSEIKPRD